MARYDLLVESGPKRRKTMVHVPRLPGCCVMGPTTEEALEAAPAEIRAYLGWVRGHGEEVELSSEVQTRVVEHVTKGDFLGQGGATFTWDHRDLTGPEVRAAAERWGWLRADVLAELAGVGAKALVARPRSGDRALMGIAVHVLGAGGSYLSPAFGGTPEVGRLSWRVEKGELDAVAALEEQAPLLRERLAQLANVRSRKDLKRPERITRGIRRLLEHEWEHLREIRRRSDRR
ncbi:MAG: hypothetical protein LC722_06785 [Actinobacteria bacterium]|nr:hypothetical protein [Actinomycetota bacterium]